MASGDARGVKPPEMDVSRAVDSDSISQSSQTRRHHGAALSQRWSVFENFQDFQLQIQGFPLRNVHFVLIFIDLSIIEKTRIVKI